MPRRSASSSVSRCNIGLWQCAEDLLGQTSPTATSRTAALRTPLRDADWRRLAFLRSRFPAPPRSSTFRFLCCSAIQHGMPVVACRVITPSPANRSESNSAADASFAPVPASDVSSLDRRSPANAHRAGSSAAGSEANPEPVAGAVLARQFAGRRFSGAPDTGNRDGSHQLEGLGAPRKESTTGDQ